MSNSEDKKNKTLEFSSLTSTLLGSQRTFLSIIRTVSIFVALTILIKNHWILIAVLILFLFSIYDYNRGYHNLEELVHTFLEDENKSIINNITKFNTTLYGYCLVLIFIFIVVIKQFYDKKI